MMNISHAAVLFFVFVLAGFEPTQAKTHLIFHLTGYHQNVGYYDYDTKELTPYNGNNYGLGVGYDISKNVQFRVGGYKNSHNKNSFYTGFSINTDSRKRFGAGFLLGAVSGYENTANRQKYNEPIAPVVLPYVTANIKNVGIEFGLLPVQDGLFTLSASLAF